MAKRLDKAQNLARWKQLPDANPLESMEVIPYKARGSKYGACGIRIDGTPAFIDAVLSKLKDLIDGENVATRLELSRAPVDGSGIGKALPNAAGRDAECCYIRLHERGREGSMMLAYCGGKDLAAATKRYADTVGVG